MQEYERMKKEQKKENIDLVNKINELTNDLQRTRADFENYRKNVENRVMDAKNLGERKAVNNILPIIDDIERAIAHLPEELADNAWAQSVAKMYDKLEKNLAKNGIEKINSKTGEVFNPEVHEAIQFEDGDGETEIIVEELRIGYKLHGNVLRHSMVKVTKK